MSEETYGLEEEILHGNSKKQTIPAGATFFYSSLNIARYTEMS